MGDRLRKLWDFGDLEATGARLRLQLNAETGDAGRAEVLTLVARLQGLRGEFRAGEAVLRRAERLAGKSATARIRIDLERGRLLRSSGDLAAAMPLFVSAYENATSAGEEFMAADAAHMAAIAAPDRAGKLAWTQRGIDIAQATSDRDVAYWLGPLLNNLGVEYAESGEHEAALGAFQRALEARLRYPENPEAIQSARESVEEARRALGAG
jgi:tetratricopeptide (TPR) repeat protein